MASKYSIELVKLVEKFIQRWDKDHPDDKKFKPGFDGTPEIPQVKTFEDQRKFLYEFPIAYEWYERPDLPAVFEQISVGNPGHVWAISDKKAAWYWNGEKFVPDENGEGIRNISVGQDGTVHVMGIPEN